MKVMMLLADHAVVAEGKLYINGGGWSVTGPGAAASALAIKIEVPWSRANDKISMHLRLVGEDGQPVTIEGPLGSQPIEIRGEFEAGRPPGMRHGTPIDVALAFPIGPLPLPPGQRFNWQLQLNGETREEWHVAFSTRELPPGVATYAVDPGSPEG